MRPGLICAAFLLLLGFLGVCWWAIPQATAVDRAVLFTQALTTRQDAVNYEALTPEIAGAISRDEFGTASADIRHLLATNGVGAFVVEPGHIAVSAQRQFTVGGMIGGRETSIPIRFERADGAHQFATLELRGVNGESVPIRIGLERDAFWWRVLSLDVAGKPAFDARGFAR